MPPLQTLCKVIQFSKSFEEKAQGAFQRDCFSTGIWTEGADMVQDLEPLQDFRSFGGKHVIPVLRGLTL